MPNKHNPPLLTEILIKSLKSVNNTGQLTYLINQLNERKTSSEAEVYVLILACAFDYPKIRNHPHWGKLQKLWQDCYTSKPPEIIKPEIFEVLNRPKNAKVKTLFNQFMHFELEHEMAPKPDKPTLKRTRKQR